MAHSGYNTFHGFDNGPPPPSFGPQHPPGPPQYQTWPQQPAWGLPPLAAPTYQMGPFYNQLHQALPGAGPVVNRDIPGVLLKNHLGGTGVPYGYDYLFPAVHARVHVFKTKEKPWQITTPLHPFQQPLHPLCKFASVSVSCLDG